MGPRFRTLPTTAAPIKFNHFLFGMVAALSGKNSKVKFQEQLKQYFNVKHIFLVSSGKAAIYLTINALKQISKRREIIIPAYSSFCLAAAVARIGMPVKLCDIDPETLDFDLKKLKSLINENTLAVIPVHNYGLVCNMREINRLASAKGALVVEDSAQAAGAMFDGRKVGTIGDVGILSLGRGKNICALGGGVILTSNDTIAHLIDKSLGTCPKSSVFSYLTGLTTGIAMGLFLNPQRYFFPHSMPFLNLGANIFDPDFKITSLSPLNAGIGQRTFKNLDMYNDIRIRNATLMKESLKSSTSIMIPKHRSNGNGRSVFLRFPILFKKQGTRDNALKMLSQQRLGASASYPTPLSHIRSFNKCLVKEDALPGSQFVADRILTLPTHPYVGEQDISLITSTIYNSAC